MAGRGGWLRCYNRRVELWAYVLLGALQGLTEFLPVSSSGHLVLAEHWLHLNPPGVALEVALHVATLFSVLIVYGRDIVRLAAERNWRYFGYLALGTIITVAIALPFKQVVSDITDAEFAPRLVGGMLLITALWLLAADFRLRRKRPPTGHSWLSSALAGIAQALAILPGISRSGATIGTLVQTGRERTEAARFSFLLSVPVILGAGILSIPDMLETVNSGSISAVGLSLAAGTALLTGVAAIYLVLAALHRARLSYFAAYCIALGIAALVIG